MQKPKFEDFKLAVKDQFSKMAEADLFMSDVTKDNLWETYLSSFPEGTNPIYKERTEHDCQCCKQFIRACGNAVEIVNNKLVSIWDIKVGGHYQPVADELSKLVKAAAVRDIFLHYERNLGTSLNHQMLEDGSTKKWEHFHFKLPKRFVNVDKGSVLSERKSSKDVLKRGLEEITIEAIETVLELIEQKSIYRGEENKSAVESFLKLKEEFGKIVETEKDNFCWVTSVAIGGLSRIRNTAIGTLLTDVSEGISLDEAVKLFESKVAPENYKRPTALITKSMISNAQKKVAELGIEESLSRRYANSDDITINNILFANREIKKAMNVFDELSKEAPVNIKKYQKVDDVDIDTFIETILPKADSLELMFENKHTNNLMSLIAPQDKEAKGIFKWGNNFSWAYNGEVADSMKQRVKAAGGKVDGVLRFSIQWNDGDNNQNDFDAHCIEPNGNLISYSSMKSYTTLGNLDVDIINPGSKTAVENITWPRLDKMSDGRYKFIVHNYAYNGGDTGFTAEIEYDGEIYSYEYNKRLKQKEKVLVAEIEFSKEKGIKFIESLSSTKASKEAWGINTNNFHNVSMVMASPNHWDGEKTGNKHYFFILDSCKNDKKARGFFNEFLNEDLSEHRKVFEVLGSKMKAEETDNQLSGLGFSTTQKNYVICKVTGSFTRTIKITLNGGAVCLKKQVS